MYTVSEGENVMDCKRKSNQQIGGTQASAERRTVVLDIETVALDPSDEKGALDSMTGRVVCVGMLVDDGKAAKEITFAGEDEARIITGFWDALRPGDAVVGHNVLDFDIRFLQQRSWILGIQPSRTLDTRRYYTADVIDTLQLWTNWSGNKKVSRSTRWAQLWVVAEKPARARTSPSGGQNATSTASRGIALKTCSSLIACFAG